MMRRLLGLLSFSLVIAASPAFAISQLLGGIFTTSAAADAAANASGCRISGYAVTATCSSFGATTDYRSQCQDPVSGLGMDVMHYCVVSACPTGYTASGTTCVAGASDADKTAAGTAAQAAASADGYNATASTAAQTAASNTLNDWVAAGKTLTEAKQAAKVAGAMAAEKSAYDQNTSLYTTFKSSLASTGESQATMAAYDAYVSGMKASGANVGVAKIFQVTKADGSGLIEYESTRDASGASAWDVRAVSNNGVITSWLGTTTSVSFSPSDTGATALGALTPSVTEVSTGKITAASPTTSTYKASAPTDDPVVVFTPSTSTVTYFDKTTGAKLGSISASVDGTVTTLGTVPANASSTLNKASQGLITGVPASTGTVATTSGSSGTGGGSAVCGAAPLPACETTVGNFSDVSGITGAMGTMGARFEEILNSGSPAHGWSLSLPSIFPVAAACNPWVFHIGGGDRVIDPCPVANNIRHIAEFVLYVLTLFGLFRILFRPNPVGAA